MRLHFLAPLGLGLALAVTGARAETLPLPANLIDVQSDDGGKFLFESEARAAYFPLTINFLTQKTQAYCGVASITMVLNALKLPSPTTPEYQPYHTFTQDNLLDEKTDAILPRDVLAHHGMTLDQLGALLGTQPISVEVVHAGDSGLDQFRARARDFLSRKDHFVVVNYLRMAIGVKPGEEWPSLCQAF